MIARWILDDKHERQVRVFMVFNVWEWNALQMFSDLTHHFFFRGDSAEKMQQQPDL